VDAGGVRGWNSFIGGGHPDEDLGLPPPDDVGYLRGLIQEVGRRFALDDKRVYLVGHSAGGCMADAMAVASAELIAGIASLASTLYFDSTRFTPSEPVHILHIHGTADAAALYWGGAVTIGPLWFNAIPFPAVVRTIQVWAGYNGAQDPVKDPAPTLDLDSSISGLDTVVTRYTNCPAGGVVELWTINNSGHRPTLSAEFSPRLIDWLLAHPKP